VITLSLVPHEPEQRTSLRHRDPRLRSIAQNINNRNGAVTVTLEIAIEVGEIREGISDYISQTQTANLVQLLDSLQGLVLQLIPEVEHFAQGADL